MKIYINKSYKKLFSLTLILTTTLSLLTLTACGGDKADKTSSDKAIGSSTSAPQDDVKGENAADTSSAVSSFVDVREVEAPDVIGLPLDEAIKYLEEKGFAVDTEIEYKMRITKNREFVLADVGTVGKQEKDRENNCIVLYYQGEGDRFNYTINDDGTIILGRCTSYRLDRDFIVPKIYKDRKVVAITSDLADFLIATPNFLEEGCQTKVPQGIMLNDEPFSAPQCIFY